MNLQRFFSTMLLSLVVLTIQAQRIGCVVHSEDYYNRLLNENA